MALSFYDQPAQSNVINTYVAAPYQEILQAGLAKQGRYDETLAAMQANQEYLDQLQTIEGSGQADYLTQSKAVIADISTSFANKDLSDPFIRRQLRDEIRRRIDPTKINNIVQSQKNLAERNKKIAEYDARGLYYEPYERTQDPYYTKQLSADQVYNYTPRAFQDPDEMIINRFKSLPVSERSSIEGDQIIRYESNKDAINQTMNETVRNIKDSVQGQWIITQSKLNGTYTGDDNSTVQAYIESLRPEYTINNRLHQGFVPEYIIKGRKSKEEEMVVPNFSPTLDQQAQPKEKSEYKGKQFVNKYYSDLSTLREYQSQLSYAKDPNKKKELQNKIGLLQGDIERREQIFNTIPEYKEIFNEENRKLNDIKDLYDDVSKSDIDKINKAIKANNYEDSNLHKQMKKKYGYFKTNTLVDHLSDLNKYVEKKRKTVARKGINELDLPSETTDKLSVTPQIRTSNGVVSTYDSVITGQQESSKLGMLFNFWNNNPDMLEGRIESQDGEDIKIKEFKDSDGMILNAYSTLPDEKGWYVSVTTTKDDKSTGRQYKIYLDNNNPTQKLSLAEDLLHNGNWADSYRILNDHIANSIVQQRNSKNINVPVLDYRDNQYKYTKIIRNEYGTYDVVLPITGRELSGLTEGGVEQALYEDEVESFKLAGGTQKQLASHLYQQTRRGK
ncbi:MAG: hypothetical protein WC346_18470 [Methanogenium sp.]|jgi:hypothetical protein